jgi:anti-anti-sigma factor
MEIQKERVGDTSVVTASGRLDGIYSSAFANQVGELVTEANPKILIDFADIDFVTSAGLRALLLLVKKAKASGSVFALCGVNEQVREVLDISGFPAMFSIYADRAEGVAALQVIDPSSERKMG